MNRVLITGGAGFIGLHLARALHDRGAEVVLADNLTRGRRDEDLEEFLSRKRTNLVAADLSDPGAFDALGDQFDYIYHLAAVIGVRHVMERPHDVLRVNAETCIQALEFARRQRALKKFFFSSTSEVYAGTLKHFGMTVPTPETTPLAVLGVEDARCSYSLSKMYGEALALQYANRFAIPVRIGRYHNVYGERMGYDHVVPEMFVKINRSPEVLVSSPTHTRAFCHVADAVEMTIRATEATDLEPRIVNIGNPVEITIETLVKTIGRVMETDLKLKLAGDTPGSPARRCPDIARIRALTGYEPKVSLDEGLRRTLAWYKNRDFK